MLRKWLERRRQERRDDDYRRGYGWAWSAFMVDEESLEHIEALASMPIPTLDQFDAFDRGAQQAISDIERLTGVTEAA